MSSRLSNLISMVQRHASKGPTELAKKTIKFAGESLNSQLQLRGVTRVGINARVEGNVSVFNEGRIEIGNNLSLRSPWLPTELRAENGGELVFGDDCILNYGSLYSAKQSVRIGNRVMIAQQCVVADTEVPNANQETVNQHGASLPAKAIEIGDDAWIAARCTILPGTTIGAGSVITAGSVVSGTIPPGVIAGGIPARVLRKVDGSESKEAAAQAEVAAAAPKAAPVKPKVKFNGQVIADFTADELAQIFENDLESPGATLNVAPFGQVVPQLMMGPPPDSKDFALVWTRPETSLPSFARVLLHEQVNQEDLDGDVDAFVKLLVQGSSKYRYMFVPTWTHPAWNRGLGVLDAKHGVTRALAAINLRLMQKLDEHKNIFVLDAQRWVSNIGRNANNPKLWLMGKVAFHSDVLKEAVRDVKAALRAVSGEARKLLVLDLDDTMWGGIVGDQGWQNLRLGGHDSLGESFVDFQKAVKAVMRRGVVLAIVSKNEESVAMEAITSHPEMVLKRDDFVAWRINWKDKARNIAEIADELNLGLQSVVFIDDNPVERARVREALPEVLVPEWPEDKLLYKQAFLSLRCFDTPAITKEDLERTQQYTSERKRDELQKSVGDINEWLKSLEIKVKAEPLNASNIQRTVQLLNKTNQMNLTTRRLSEAEMQEWVKSSNRALYAISVADKFGDAGLTGIVSVEVEGETGKIVDYVLSCRVMGRKVENTLVHVAVEAAKKRGAKKIEAKLIPTPKNKPCATFWSNESGFKAPAENSYVWDVSSPYALPEAIKLEKVGE